MITEFLGKQFLWSVHVCVYYFALLGSCIHCIACCRKNGRQNEMGKELRESTGNCAATVMATGDWSRPQGIHSRGKSILFFFLKSMFKIVWFLVLWIDETNVFISIPFTVLEVNANKAAVWPPPSGMRRSTASSWRAANSYR